MKSDIFETRCLSSLAKVFADAELEAAPFTGASALLNETFHFQVAFRAKGGNKGFRVQVDTALKPWVSVRRVGLVPSELPIYHDHDEAILRATPGLYPDPLFPMDEGEVITAVAGQWRAVWLTVSLDGRAPAGSHPIRIAFLAETGEILGEEHFTLEVLPVALPKQRLKHTNWFHGDCIATHYGVEVFSEEHWRLLESYIRTAVAHGINMILTPLFTPPLDTAVGGERPTAQLVGVEKEGGAYRFDFARLKRWIGMCSDLGVEYFEFSHLFTQWGAKHAPKIVGTENGRPVRLFGWETDAAGEDYKAFLDQFLPALVRFIKGEGLEKRCYFHVSDEPHMDHLEAYAKASAILRDHLQGFPIIDALSDIDFYRKGLIRTPVPATDHIEPFLAEEIEERWAYYCCGQYKEVANRFFCYPSARNRVFGLQLYKFGIAGFLQWGYNFWYTVKSKHPIDPFKVTDAGLAFPSGDPFVVYPGPTGPIESLRLEVFHEGLQDLRALQLLEEYIGREKTIALLEEDLKEPLTFSRYPIDEAWLLAKRQAINDMIKQKA
ncbi:MAG: DUF4091 domain-containing protein [Patescibacteria group bacterium]